MSNPDHINRDLYDSFMAEDRILSENYDAALTKQTFEERFKITHPGLFSDEDHAYLRERVEKLEQLIYALKTKVESMDSRISSIGATLYDR